jgi:ribosomal protein S18 acetylase RimI-like enzyme
MQSSYQPKMFRDSHADSLYSEIRLATEEDFPEIINIIAMTISTTYVNRNENSTITPIFTALESMQYIESECKKYYENLNDSKHTTFVACVDNKVIGFTRIVKDDDSCHLEKLYVLPEYCGDSRQFGKKLMLACLRSCKEIFGSSAIDLEVWQKNSRAIHFYNNLKFFKTGPETSRKFSSGVYYSDVMVCNDTITAESIIQKSLSNRPKK